MKTNKLCLTLIHPHAHYGPIPVMKPQTSFRRIDDSSLMAACHCGAEYETVYSVSIETHTSTSIDNHLEESIDSSPDDWENDYYNPTLAVHTAIPSTKIPCIQRSMMRIMRWNELQRIEVFVLRKINFSTIPLGQGMRRRSTIMSQHRLTLIITRKTANKHRPKLPTTHPSTLELTVHKKKTTQLAVGQMIAITRAMQ